MSNEGKLNVCLQCIRKEKCNMRKKNPDAVVVDCGRYEPTEEMTELIKSFRNYFLDGSHLK